VLVVDLSSADPAHDLAVVRAELAAHDSALAARPSLVVGTKTDLAPAADPQVLLAAGAIAVSAVSGRGVDVLRESLEGLAREAADIQEEERPSVVLRPARPRFVIRREGDRFRVVGRGVERWVSETDLEDEQKVERLQKRLVREGVERQLALAGAKRGDEVVIGAVSFEFIPQGEDVEGPP
jgi:GTP-binding protein